MEVGVAVLVHDVHSGHHQHDQGEDLHCPHSDQPVCKTQPTQVSLDENKLTIAASHIVKDRQTNENEERQTVSQEDRQK